MKIRVTLGLCIKNSGKTVETALDSISKQDYPHGAMKLVIVDEDENGDTLPHLNAFAKKTDLKMLLFIVQNKGLGASRQMVIDNAEGDYVVWVDHDFVLNHDFISKHVAFMDAHPYLGAARADETLAKRTQTTMIELLGAYHEIFSGLNNTGDPMGGFEIFRLNAINQVGGFDTNIKGAAEDRDISIRIKNAGWLFAQNDSAKYYRKYPPTTWKAFWHKRFWYGYGVHFIFRKHRKQGVHWELFFPSALLISVRDSLTIYKIARKRKILFLMPYYLSGNLASSLGFFCADLQGYGNNVNS